MKKIRIKLTNEEYNLLNKITSQTKVDCWFALDVDSEGFNCVKDLERGHKVTLRFAIKLLNEAIENCTNLTNLTKKEITIYEQLMIKLKLSNPFRKDT